MTSAPSGRTTSSRPTEPVVRSARPARAAAVGLVLALVLAALPGCGGGGDGPPPRRERVVVVGPELENELGNIQDAFAPFEAANDIEVVVTGSSSFEERIGGQVTEGRPPDIALFPQPGLLLDHADRVVPVPDELADEMQQDFGQERLDRV